VVEGVDHLCEPGVEDWVGLADDTDAEDRGSLVRTGSGGLGAEDWEWWTEC
jgi:hypothetical protein